MRCNATLLALTTLLALNSYIKLMRFGKVEQLDTGWNKHFIMPFLFCFVLFCIVIDKKPAKPTKANLPRNRSFGTFQREFHMGDTIEFCVNGVEVS